jgi:DNA-binding NarL/FixJ family response regulator
MKIRVLLADDHTVVRYGLRMLLETADDMEVVAEAANGREAVELAQRLAPQVAVLDVIMPQLNGLDAARRIGREAPQTKILILSTYAHDHFVEQALAASVSGYLTKETAASELLRAIRAIVAGKQYFSPSMSKKVIEFAPNRAAPRRLTFSGKPLTARESEVLQLIAEGDSNKTIADKLHISIKTIEKHRQSVMQKLNIHETAGLTRYAINHGMIQVQPP